jgi:hypothetical protein
MAYYSYFRLDEEPSTNWTLGEANVDSLAAAMIVFILCDFWRLFIGSIEGNPTDLPFL